MTDNVKEERNIVTQPYDFSISMLCHMMKEGQIFVNKEYQRSYVWNVGNDETKPSKLIESLLLNIPVPSIYLAETDTSQEYEIIDGQQRLTSCDRFLKDEFRLTGLEFRKDIDGLLFSELSTEDKSNIKKRVIRCIAILNDSSKNIKYEIFSRLNSGSIEITNQQFRKANFRGEFSKLLEELADNDNFRKCLNELDNPKKNGYLEELVLRFFAYYSQGIDNLGTGSGGISLFLTEFMEKHQNSSEEEISKFRDRFNNTFSKVFNLFSDNSFSSISKAGRWNNKPNKALYDAQMLAVAFFPVEKMVGDSTEIKKNLRELLESDSFKKLIQGSDTKATLNQRVRMMMSILK